jgi:2-oxoglutarate dehydrogenase E2 component (dihydrolipoamide succinyltransferase)
MILEMKVPSPGIYKRSWNCNLVSKRRLRRKDQGLQRLILIKQLWNHLKQVEYHIKSRRRWCSSRAVVCLIDTAAAKPEGSAPTSSSRKQKRQKRLQPSSGPAATYASGHLQQQENIRRKYRPASLTGTGKDGRITKDDAVNAVPSMEPYRRKPWIRAHKTVNVAP